MCLYVLCRLIYILIIFAQPVSLTLFHNLFDLESSLSKVFSYLNAQVSSANLTPFLMSSTEIHTRSSYTLHI